jgi:hypothetical protein
VGHASLALKAEGAVGRLGRVLVDPARPGEGQGRALVTSAVTAGFEQTRIDSMTLGVYRHNTAAHRLYESIGFLATQTRIAATKVRRSIMGPDRDAVTPPKLRPHQAENKSRVKEGLPVLLGVNVVHARCAARAPR